jgi:hypothetical protein
MWPKGPTTWLEGRTLNVSIPFTWNLPAVRHMLMCRDLFWDTAIVGGPAVELMPDYLAGMGWVTISHDCPGVLQRVNPLATRTTEGCTRTCGFCGIGSGKIEKGGFQVLTEWPDLPVLCDNNLLAAPREHFDKVIDRLIRHGWADFNQGLDPRLLTDYHAARIAEIKQPQCRLALDHFSLRHDWQAAYDKLRSAGITKKNISSYALVGFSDHPGEAWSRCGWIQGHNINVLPMWFHPLDCLVENGVTDAQKEIGWNDYERRKLMQWFYKRKYAPP